MTNIVMNLLLYLGGSVAWSVFCYLATLADIPSDIATIAAILGIFGILGIGSIVEFRKSKYHYSRADGKALDARVAAQRMARCPRCKSPNIEPFTWTKISYTKVRQWICNRCKAVFIP